MKFIHTADWQIGKPFARVEDADKRARLRQARIDAIARVGQIARARGASFILVAGDLFDSPTVDKGTVSAACAAIGKIGLPVLAIPGNHDHAGPGSVWGQDFFQAERTNLAPNLRVLLEPVPVDEQGVIILPCPLTRRQEFKDPTEWLWRGGAIDPPSLPPDAPRVVLAHGSVQNFTSAADEDNAAQQPNLIDLDRLPPSEFDYIALGDWHGRKELRPRIWYSGTPEPDRFPKGSDYDAGNVLLVEVGNRGGPLQVTRLASGQLGWHSLEIAMIDDASVDGLKEQLDATLGDRVAADSLGITLGGTLGLEARGRLDALLQTFDARLLRLDCDDQIVVMPSEEELGQLVNRAEDPLLARVAARLKQDLDQGGDPAEVARLALRELYAAVHAVQ